MFRCLVPVQVLEIALEIGVFDERPTVFHSCVPKWSCYAGWALFTCPRPVVGDEVAQPLVLCTLLCHGLLLFRYQVPVCIAMASTVLDGEKHIFGNMVLELIFPNCALYPGRFESRRHVLEQGHEVAMKQPGRSERVGRVMLKVGNG